MINKKVLINYFIILILFLNLIIIFIPTVSAPSSVIDSSGKTFYPPQRKMVIDGNGNLYCIYESASDYDIRIAKSTDHGDSWSITEISGDVGVAEITGYNQLVPSLAISPNGTLMAVWAGTHPGQTVNDQIRCSSSTDGGITWSSVKNITTQYVQQDPCIAVNSTGSFFVVWNGITGGSFKIQYSKSDDNGDSWSSPAIVTSSEGYHNSLAIDSNDNLFIVFMYASDWSIRTINSTNSGSSWGSIKTIGTSGSYPCIAVDSNDYLHVVYRNDTGSYRVSYSKSTNYGDVWTAPYQVCDNFQSDIPSITIDSNNYLHVFWFGYYSGHTSRYYIMCRNYTSSWDSIWYDLTTATINQGNIVSLWSNYPSNNIPTSGFCFMYSNYTPTDIIFFKSSDFAFSTINFSFSNVNPLDGSTNQPTSLIWNLDIENINGDLFNWTIECSNAQSNSSNNDVNGTKNLILSVLSHATIYTVWVNATDGFTWLNESYTFKTSVPEVYVDDDADSSWYNENHVKTISEAINNVTTNGIIYIYEGTYTANVEIDKSVDIIGNSSNNTTVQSPGSSPNGIFNIITDWVNISNLNFSGATTSTHSGLKTDCNYINISNCFFYNNYYGIYVNNNDFIEIYNNTMLNILKRAIWLSLGNNITVSNNTIRNILGFGNCLFIDGSNHVTVSYNIFNPVYVPSIYESICTGIDGNNVTYYNNTCYDAYTGVVIEYNYDTLFYNNTITNTPLGLLVTETTNTLIYNNYLSNEINVNAYDNTNISWNITKTLGTNILGNPYLGGNYWSDYTGLDLDNDCLGDTLLPYQGTTSIDSGGDMHPLTFGGNIIMWVYNESNCSQCIPFDIIISNMEGTQVFEQNDNNCYVTIPIYLLPYGDDTIILVSSADYNFRMFYVNLDPNENLSMNVYLPPKYETGDELDIVLRSSITTVNVTNPDNDVNIITLYNINEIINIQIYNKTLFGTYGGWMIIGESYYTYNNKTIIVNSSILDDNTTMISVNYYYEFYQTQMSSYLYQFTVIDVFNQPVNRAKINIKRYINCTGVFENMSIIYTDGAGHADLYLIPETLYKIFISKDEYDTSIEDYVPSTQLFTRTFLILKTSLSHETIWDNLTYSIQPTTHDHYDNFTMYFNISSIDNRLTNFSITVYFYNTTTFNWDQLYYTSSTTSTGGSLNYTTVNGIGKYSLVCKFKKTGYSEYTFGALHSDNKIIYYIWETIPITNVSDDIDTTLTNSLGPSPVYVGTTVIAYSSLIGASVIVFLLFTFSPKYAGFGIGIVGIMLGVLKAPWIGIIGDVVSWTAVVIIIILGVLMTLAYKKDK